jgi:hypothetical protein
MPWWCSVKQKLARRARLRGRRRMVKEVASSAVVVVSWMWRRGGRPQPWRLRPAPTPSPPAWQAAASLDSPARQLQLWVALAAVPLVASVVDAVAPGLPVPPVYEAMGRPPMPLPAVDVERGGRCLVGPLPSLVWRATQVGPIPRRCGPGVGGTKGSPAVALPPGSGAG